MFFLPLRKKKDFRFCQLADTQPINWIWFFWWPWESKFEDLWYGSKQNTVAQFVKELHRIKFKLGKNCFCKKLEKKSLNIGISSFVSSLTPSPLPDLNFFGNLWKENFTIIHMRAIWGLWLNLFRSYIELKLNLTKNILQYVRKQILKKLRFLFCQLVDNQPLNRF